MKDTSNGVEQLNPGTMFDSIYGEGATSASSSMSSGMGMGMFSNSSVWNQLLGNQQVLDEQYDVLAGHWPENFNEVVLVADKNNEVDDYTLYSLGLKDPEEVRTLFKKMMVGESYETEKDISYTFDEILDTEFKLVMPTDMYKYNDVTGTWDDYSKDDKYMTNVVNNGTDIKVCGIIRPNDDAVSTSLSSGIGYTAKLTEYIIEEVKNSEIAKAQAISAQLMQESAKDRVEASLMSLFNEMQQLKDAMNAYDVPLMYRSLDLLKQALTEGQISLIEYFVETESIYKNLQAYMQIENQYQKVMANIYKNNL